MTNSPFVNSGYYIFGSNHKHRSELVCLFKEKAVLNEYQIFEFGEPVLNLDKYLHLARKTFPIYSPIGISKYQMSLNQVYDMHLDWITDTVRSGSKIAIVIPKVHLFPELDEILTDYVRYTKAAESIGVSLIVIFSGDLSIDFFSSKRDFYCEIKVQ